jgi:calcium-dependent protein kinase
MPPTEGIAQQMSAWLGGRRTTACSELHNIYDVDNSCLLGFGAFGRVVRGVHKNTGEPCAVKQIAKNPQDDAGIDRKTRAEALRKEVEILQMLDHPHIVRLFQHYQDHVNHYLVMELCSGGQLARFLARKHDYREGDAAYLMQQALKAIKYLHDHHVVHRDIKPDNMLLETRKPITENTLKLIDLGFASICEPGHELRQCAGTAEFMSPQVVDSLGYGIQTDMWSCGASLYYLLSGCAPFRAENEAGVFAAVRRGNYTFSTAEWKCISEDAKDLLRKLLKMNPRDRITAAEALDHEWVAEQAPQAMGVLHKAVCNFGLRRPKRKCQEEEQTFWTDINSVWSDMTQRASLVFTSKYVCA